MAPPCHFSPSLLSFPCQLIRILTLTPLLPLPLPLSDMISANPSPVPRDRSQLLLYFSPSTDSVDCGCITHVFPSQSCLGRFRHFHEKTPEPALPFANPAEGTDPGGWQEQLQSPRAAEFSLSASEPIWVPSSPVIFLDLCVQGHGQLKPS